MQEGAAALISAAHGEALRLLCKRCGRHFAGLEEASRFARLHWGADAKLVRRLRNLDHAFALVRHISEVSCQTLLDDIDEAAAGRRDRTDREVAREVVLAATPTFAAAYFDCEEKEKENVDQTVGYNMVEFKHLKSTPKEEDTAANLQADRGTPDTALQEIILAGADAGHGTA